MRFFVVKTTADVRQVLRRTSVKRPRERPKKMGLLEVNFVDQEMNFRIVKKKPLEFMVKSRTTSDEVKKWILEKKKGPSEDKISSRIVLYIVSTVRLRKALRVMWTFVSGGKCTLVVREPQQGPKNWVLAHQRALVQKNCQFRSHARNLSSSWNFCQTQSQTQQIHWTGLDLI